MGLSTNTSAGTTGPLEPWRCQRTTSVRSTAKAGDHQHAAAAGHPVHDLGEPLEASDPGGTRRRRSTTTMTTGRRGDGLGRGSRGGDGARGRR